MTAAQRRRKPTPQAREFRVSQQPDKNAAPIPVAAWLRGTAIEARLNAGPKPDGYKCPMAGSVAMERNNGKR